MPLLLSTLEAELEKIMDSNSPLFIGMPSNQQQVASNWANAIYNYASTILPVSTTASAARTSLETILLGAAAPNSFFPAFQAGLSAFATQIAIGMQPAYTGTPPPTPIDIQTALLAIPLEPTLTPLRISTMANIIHVWFKTGTAVLNNPPNTVVMWS
jgi:hypothetical protein